MKPIQIQATDVFLRCWDVEPHLAGTVACQTHKTLDDMHQVASKLESDMLSKILPDTITVNQPFSVEWNRLQNIQFQSIYLKITTLFIISNIEPSNACQEEGHYEWTPYFPIEFEDFYSHSLDDESNLYNDYDNQYVPGYPDAFEFQKLSEKYEAPSELFTYDPFRWEPNQPPNNFQREKSSEAWPTEPEVHSTANRNEPIVIRLRIPKCVKPSLDLMVDNGSSIYLIKIKLPAR